MADGLDTAGDVILELAEIITVSGTTADITEVVSYIEIFEDIQNPLLQGSISFTDSVNLKDLGPLVGQELLKLKIKTPSLEAEWEVIESLFVLYDLVNTTEINQNNNTTEASNDK